MVDHIKGRERFNHISKIFVVDNLYVMFFYIPHINVSVFVCVLQPLENYNSFIIIQQSHNLNLLKFIIIWFFNKIKKKKMRTLSAFKFQNPEILLFLQIEFTLKLLKKTDEQAKEKLG